MLLTIFILEEQSFKQVHCWYKKIVKSSTLFFANKSGLPSQLTLLTENSLSNCHFSEKDVLQIIRNTDSNKAHDMIWSEFVY